MLAPVGGGSGGSLAVLGPAPSPGVALALCLFNSALSDGMEPRYSSRAPLMRSLSRLAVVAVAEPAVVVGVPAAVAVAVAAPLAEVLGRFSVILSKANVLFFRMTASAPSLFQRRL